MTPSQRRASGKRTTVPEDTRARLRPPPRTAEPEPGAGTRFAGATVSLGARPPFPPPTPGRSDPCRGGRAPSPSTPARAGPALPGRGAQWQPGSGCRLSAGCGYEDLAFGDLRCRHGKLGRVLAQPLGRDLVRAVDAVPVAGDGDRDGVTAVVDEVVGHEAGHLRDQALHVVCVLGETARQLGVARIAPDAYPHGRPPLGSPELMRPLPAGQPFAYESAPSAQGAFTYPERKGDSAPDSGSYEWRQTQPVSFVSRWIETEVSGDVVRTRWMSSCGGISA